MNKHNTFTGRVCLTCGHEERNDGVTAAMEQHACRPRTGTQPPPPHGEFPRFEPGWLLKNVTDDELRAECSRRGIGNVSEPVCAVAERDEWKRRAEEYRDDMHRARKERGWAEDQLARITGNVGLKPMCDGREQGAGITNDQRPDNSIAHLDEDLLCEDA